jgi:hypothetical protein
MSQIMRGRIEKIKKNDQKKKRKENQIMRTKIDIKIKSNQIMRDEIKKINQEKYKKKQKTIKRIKIKFDIKIKY